MGSELVEIGGGQIVHAWRRVGGREEGDPKKKGRGAGRLENVQDGMGNRIHSNFRFLSLSLSLKNE